MGIYETYKEAVLANGGTKGVYTDSVWFYTNRSESEFYGVHKCNPADHLETLESFLASGKRLKYGDLYVELHGVVTKVLSETDTNTKSSRDHERFILQAAADQMETPEGKEAFDAIDTAPQQVESLSENEWKNGDTLLWKNINGEFLECNTGRYIGYDYEDDFHVFVMTDDGAAYRVVSAHSDGIARPKTPAEREERERLEAAYDLYCEVENADGDEPYDFDFWRTMERKVEGYLAIVDKTGYRKKEED